MLVAFNPRSSNVKTGPIPVTTSPRSTCPNSCPLRGGDCYAENYGLNFVWNGVDRGNGEADNGKPASAKDLKSLVSWGTLCDKVRALPRNQLWRHNQAGDLPNRDDDSEAIDYDRLMDLAKANEGRRGFTYTHKPLACQRNREAIEDANKSGFTINVSANNLQEADRALALGLPAVATVPMDYPKTGVSPAGNKVLVCCAQQTEEDTPGIEGLRIDCNRCGICQKRDRGYIVAFRAHGTNRKKLSLRLEVKGV